MGYKRSEAYFTYIRDGGALKRAEHSGIKGQKWGVRRFQNEDGTLTEAGKDRYGSGEGEKKSSGSDKWKPGDARSLSDEELKKRNARLQQEQQYQSMTESPVAKELKSIAKKVFVGTLTGVAVGAVAKHYNLKSVQ